ncbi:MAG: metal ABC transporter substrate-binding protein [Deltaproteobacteria bacterium]|jgi:zinc transport system substrate-binding protein
MKTARMVLLIIFLCLLLASACGVANAKQESRYVATIHPLAAILEEVVGERAEVKQLLPPGSSPHTFEPKPSDAVMLERALALFYVGPNLDREWTQGLPAAHKIEALQLIPKECLLPMTAHEHGEGEEEHNHGHIEAGTIDPHLWTDPLTVKAMLPALVEKLSTLDPGGRAAYERNGKAFAVRLERLNAEVGKLLVPVQGKPILLFHPSFQYLIARYHLKLAGLIEPFPGREPSPRTLERLIKKIRRLNVRALFTEPQLPVRPARVIAETADLKLYQLDPLGGIKGRQSYEEIILYNARTLRKALE